MRTPGSSWRFWSRIGLGFICSVNVQVEGSEAHASGQTAGPRSPDPGLLPLQVADSLLPAFFQGLVVGGAVPE